MTLCAISRRNQKSKWQYDKDLSKVLQCLASSQKFAGLQVVRQKFSRCSHFLHRCGEGCNLVTIGRDAIDAKTNKMSEGDVREMLQHLQASARVIAYCVMV